MSSLINPFPPKQQQQLQKILSGATREQLVWLSGYINGLSSKRILALPGALALQQQASQSGNKPLTILYGTHTGHSKEIAKRLLQRSLAESIPAKLLALDEFNPRTLSNEENVAIIVSTHGEGEPPLMAEEFHEFLKRNSTKLDKLNYSILALGDRSYKMFCQTGIEIDQWLNKAGAKRISAIVNCDVDFEVDANNWIKQLIEKLKLKRAVKPLLLAKSIVRPQVKPVYSRSNPFFAKVLEKRIITGQNSDKEVWHIELSLEDSGLSYEPGDALGVFTNNPPELVQQILDFTGLQSNATITTRYGDVTLYEALYHHFEITVLNRKVIEDYNELAHIPKLKRLIFNTSKLNEYIESHDLLDLLQDFPTKLTPHRLVSVLRYLPPRLYSISSSIDAIPGEVHLTVAKVDFDYKERRRKGACSSYIAERLTENEKVPVFIEKNINFRLPQDNTTPVIMIGAGTGVAPYRAFLQDFESKGRKNSSWLFFGERTFSENFLYQVEWQKYLQKGVLGRIELAFLRDRQEKVYVQHKLQEHAPELFQWLEKGAHLYICGDRKKLFYDVQNTLLQIIRTQGGVTEEKAQEYLKNLQKQKRYQLDVY
jgi:sulfite reductase (NADPH) flavoprotein alpha-component